MTTRPVGKSTSPPLELDPLELVVPELELPDPLDDEPLEELELLPLELQPPELLELSLIGQTGGKQTLPPMLPELEPLLELLPEPDLPLTLPPELELVAPEELELLLDPLLVAPLLDPPIERPKSGSNDSAMHLTDASLVGGTKVTKLPTDADVMPKLATRLLNSTDPVNPSITRRRATPRASSPIQAWYPPASASRSNSVR